MKNVKVLDTEALKAACAVARARRMNRLPELEFLRGLDPEGRHVITWEMLHTNFAGVSSRRVWMMAKMAGREDAEHVVLDLPVDTPFETYAV